MRRAVGQQAVPLQPQVSASDSVLILAAVSGDSAERIEQLMLGSIISPQEASRLCAVQWANRLFPFSQRVTSVPWLLEMSSWRSGRRGKLA